MIIKKAKAPKKLLKADRKTVQPPVEKLQQAAPLRVALYTHDTFGLGHIRRCLHLIHAIAARVPNSAILLVTGSPAVQSVQGFPPNADYVKIPTLVKTGASGSQPPHLPMALPEVQLLREKIIRESVIGFRPDIFIADNFPLGNQRELLPTLQELQKLKCKVIVGLRDIVDAPEVVCTDWKRQGMYEILERYYDQILIYGMRDVLDAETAYNLPAALSAKLSYCGYVTEHFPKLRSSDEIRRELGVKGKLILATGGGGGDAFPLLQAFIAAMLHVPGASGLIFTGPLMGKSDIKALQAEAKGNPGIIIKDFVKDLRSYMAASDLVVSMCGYNIAAEILAQKAKAIVVPRTWRYGEHTKGNQAGMEWEQILRAQAFAKLGFVDLIEPEMLQPEILSKHILLALKTPVRKSASTLSMDGLKTAVDHILNINHSSKENHK